MERKSFSTEIYPPSFGAKKNRECEAPRCDAYIYIASSTGNVLAKSCSQFMLLTAKALKIMIPLVTNRWEICRR